MIQASQATYVHAKEGCYLCGTAAIAVDTEVSIEGEGALALCKGCIGDLARTAGFVCDAEAEELRADVDSLSADLSDTLERAGKAEGLIKELVSQASEIVQRDA